MTERSGGMAIPSTSLLDSFRKTLWVLYETWDNEWWQPVKDGDEYEMEDLRERMKALPRMLGKRIVKLVITDYGTRPDESNKQLSTKATP